MVVLSNGLLDNEECDENLNGFVVYRENCAGYLLYFFKLSQLSYNLRPARNAVFLVPTMSWGDYYAQE